MTDDWREVTAEWVGETAFEGRNHSGRNIQMGSVHGQPGMSPMELILIGVAGCTGMDVVSILGKKRQIFDKFEIKVRGKRAETHPRVYTEIEVTYEFWGEKLDPKMVEQAIHLSEDKYCSVSAMLSAKATISSRYVIHQNPETVLSM